MRSSMNYLLMCVISLTTMLRSQSKYPNIDASAPSISIKEWITHPMDGENPFKGKAVVLEFWATWCAPCIAAMPHLNDLAKSFANQKLAFVSITAEDRPIVENFLKSHAMNSSVVLDNKNATFRAFGVDGIPHTFLVDSRGILRWHGHPTELNAGIIKTLLQSRKIPRSDKPSVNIFALPAEIDKSVFALIINPSHSIPIGAGTKGQLLTMRNEDTSKIIFRGGPIAGFVSRLFAIPDTRIQEENAPQDAIDVTFRVVGNPPDSLLRQRVIQAVCDAFQITVDSKPQIRKGWAVSISDTNKLHPSTAKKGSSSTSVTKSTWIGSNVTVSVLVNALESSFRQHFFDETGLSQGFDFEVPVADFSELTRTLENQYGLSITNTERAIEITHIRPKASK